VERALELARHFAIPAAVCVNRWDVFPAAAERIESLARHHGAEVAGRVRYDATVTAAQLERRSTVELGGAAADDIRALWDWLTSRWFPGLAAGLPIT
jgi:MinD superfamily P-loop ATPase